MTKCMRMFFSFFQILKPPFKLKYSKNHLTQHTTYCCCCSALNIHRIWSGLKSDRCEAMPAYHTYIYSACVLLNDWYVCRGNIFSSSFFFTFWTSEKSNMENRSQDRYGNKFFAQSIWIDFFFCYDVHTQRTRK